MNHMRRKSTFICIEKKIFVVEMLTYAGHRYNFLIQQTLSLSSMYNE